MKQAPLTRKTPLERRTPLARTNTLQDTTPPDRGREKRATTLPAAPADEGTVPAQRLRRPEGDPGRRAHVKRPARRPPKRSREEREQLDALTTAFVQETYEACEHRCANCGYEGPHLQAHHVVSQNTIKRHFGTIQELWSSDNGLLLCAEPAPNRCHPRHELAVARIPRAKLRPENEAFAEAFGFGWYLERYYGPELGPNGEPVDCNCHITEPDSFGNRDLIPSGDCPWHG